MLLTGNAGKEWGEGTLCLVVEFDPSAMDDSDLEHSSRPR